MSDSDTITETRTARPRLQFSILEVLAIMAAIAIFLSCYALWGNDGLLLASITAPTILVPITAGGSIKHRIQMTVSAILLTVGVTWCIMFPKTSDILRPDTFASILLGVGLVGSGVLLRGKRSFVMLLLSSLLLWSLLLNLALFNNLSAASSLLKSVVN